MSVYPVSMTAGAIWPADASTASAGVTGATSPTEPTAATGGAQGAGGAGGDSFTNMLGGALDSLDATQANADNLATQAATGSLTNVADYMTVADEANIQTQLTAAVRNNALQAFQSIMGMQL